MNHMLWPTGIAAVILFWIGRRAEQRLHARSSRIFFLIAAVLTALPAALIAAYYTKLLGEPIWLYEFRATYGTEVTAAGGGVLAGFLHELRNRYPLLQRQFRKFTVPVIFMLVLIVPYIKPIFRPLGGQQFQNRWEDGVCIQSTPSSCGPASAATIAHLLGKDVEEADLARESLTYAGGTENWYLVRALRKRGFTATFLKVSPAADEFPSPAIAGVKLAHGAGHFIALLGKNGTNYIVGDPLTGRLVAPLSQIRSEYRFTGFFLVVK